MEFVSISELIILFLITSIVFLPDLPLIETAVDELIMVWVNIFVTSSGFIVALITVVTCDDVRDTDIFGLIGTAWFVVVVGVVFLVVVGGVRLVLVGVVVFRVHDGVSGLDVDKIIVLEIVGGSGELT